MKSHRWFYKSLSLSGFIIASAAGISRGATLSGQVTDEKNAPAADVQVVVPALQTGAKTDNAGAYKIDNLPAGSYVVEIRRVGYPPETRQADMSKGDVTLNVGLSGSPLTLAPITITAAPEAKSTLNTPSSVSVVEGRKLDRLKGEAVIQEIQNEPGVSMIAEGQNVAKPVIRGLNSQEIVIAEDGVRSEAEQWGNEHAPEIDPLGTARIEVMRGPNSLLYGSDAIAGVILINHPELPNAHLGDGPLRGRFTTIANSNDNSLGENFEMSGAEGDWGYRANVGQIQAGNFHTPEIGSVPNTGSDLVDGSGEVGFRKDWGGLSAEFSKWNKRLELQNPNNPFPPRDNLTDSEFQVLHHEHGKIHADIVTAPARLDITAGYDWVNRKEYDTPDVDTTQTDANGNSPNVVPPPFPHLNWIEGSYTLDAKAHLVPMGPFQGTVGFSGLRRVDQSLGVVDLTPSYNENSVGEFLVEDVPVGKFDFTFGVRGDQSQYNIQADNKLGLDFSNGLVAPSDARPVKAQSLNYSAVSGAAGGVYHITDPLAFAVNLGRGYRNPVPFELFAFGKHEGTGEFDIGNPNLQPETSFDTEASLRWASPRIKAEVGVFRNYIHNYIYSTFVSQSLLPADFSDQTIPVVQEQQSNATVKGVDGAVTVAPTDWLTLNTVYNMVRGYNDQGDPMLNTNYIPHVPADNVLVGADVHEKSLGPVSHPYFGIDEKFTAAQARTNALEIPTPGYALMGLHTGGELVVMGNRLTLDAGVDNLFNKNYIDYNSILKEFNIGNPGRNVYVKVSIPFGS